MCLHQRCQFYGCLQRLILSNIKIVCKACHMVKSSQINGQTWSYWWSWDVRGSADPVPDAKSISRRAKNLPKTGLRPDYELSDSFSLSPANQQLMRTPQQSFKGKRRNDRGTTKGILMWMKIAPKKCGWQLRSYVAAALMDFLHQRKQLSISLTPISFIAIYTI